MTGPIALVRSPLFDHLQAKPRSCVSDPQPTGLPRAMTTVRGFASRG